jgi:hypothetical protein
MTQKMDILKPLTASPQVTWYIFKIVLYMPTFFPFLASFVTNAMFFANYKTPSRSRTFRAFSRRFRSRQTKDGEQTDGEDGLIVTQKKPAVSGAAITTSSTGFTSGAVKRVTATLAVQALQ